MVWCCGVWEGVIGLRVGRGFVGEFAAVGGLVDPVSHVFCEAAVGLGLAGVGQIPVAY